VTPENAFLCAIREDPTDDGLRRIFADWLEDNGEPERAEFIRTQVALAEMGAEDPRRASLLDCERALLKEHQAAWLGAPWSEWLARCRFWRGFLHAVTMHPRTLFDSGDAFFRCFPLVRQVWLHEPSGRAQQLLDFYHEPKGYYAELLRSPHLARLELLSLRDNQVGDEAVLALAGSPHGAVLKSLDLSLNQIGATGVEALIRSPHLAHLAELDFAHNPIPWEDETALRSHFGDRVRFSTGWERPFAGTYQRRLTDWLTCAVILDEERAGTKEQVIEQLLAELVEEGRLPHDALGSVRRAILRREQLGSTGVGRGVAIPHGKHDRLDHAVGILGLVRRPVEWDSLDGEPVDIVVLALGPGGICDYSLPGVKLLGQLLREDSVCRMLRAAGSPRELLAVLEAAEREPG
jgi:uncharacterized protein (TIGR02996 family)